MIVSHDTNIYDGYIEVEPLMTLVTVVRLEYDIVVVNGGNVMMVLLDSGIGGQMSVIPGRAVTSMVAELQISGFI